MKRDHVNHPRYINMINEAIYNNNVQDVFVGIA